MWDAKPFWSGRGQRGQLRRSLPVLQGGTFTDQVNSLRGAVVERLALELIKSRYGGEDECANSRRFVDQYNKDITLHEIDVATLSYGQRRLEGYECKVKAVSLENRNCLDLAYLHRVAAEEDYQAWVGVISFDASRLVAKRLKTLNAARCIRAYGNNAFKRLQYSLFE